MTLEEIVSELESIERDLQYGWTHSAWTKVTRLLYIIQNNGRGR